MAMIAKASRYAVSAAVASVAAWPEPASARGSFGAVVAQTMEAVVLIKDGVVSACGIKAAANISGGAAAASLTLFKDAKSASGTRFVLHGLWTSAGAHPARLASLTLRTVAADTSTMFSAVSGARDGAFETTGELPPLDGANLFRELMLSGAIISMRDADGARLDLEIIGPVSPSVRAAYLNCAGDLVGPGR